MSLDQACLLQCFGTATFAFDPIISRATPATTYKTSFCNTSTLAPRFKFLYHSLWHTHHKAKTHQHSLSKILPAAPDHHLWKAGRNPARFHSSARPRSFICTTMYLPCLFLSFLSTLGSSTSQVRFIFEIPAAMLLKLLMNFTENCICLFCLWFIFSCQFLRCQSHAWGIRRIDLRSSSQSILVAIIGTITGPVPLQWCQIGHSALIYLLQTIASSQSSNSG